MVFLADTSVWAWARARDERAEKLAGRMRRGEVATCVPIALELMHNARDGDEYEEVFAETLERTTWLPVSDEAAQHALDLQRRLAGTTHGAHRLPSMDYLVVGVAIDAGSDVVVWHVDREIARLCEFAGQPHEHEAARREA